MRHCRLPRKRNRFASKWRVPDGQIESLTRPIRNRKLIPRALRFWETCSNWPAKSAYTIVLDDHNKVKAVEGAEKLKEKIVKLDPRTQELVRE